jgi:hypothetical protein
MNIATLKKGKGEPNLFWRGETTAGQSLRVQAPDEATARKRMSELCRCYKMGGLRSCSCIGSITTSYERKAIKPKLRFDDSVFD